MGLDVDYIAAKYAIEELIEMLGEQPHGERKEIADDIILLVAKLKAKYNNQEPEELLQPSPTSINQTQPTTPPQPTPVPTTQPTYNYPDINKNPFDPKNGDPWRYAYDGLKLLVKSPTTGTVYNLLDPNYATKHPNSKLKDSELRQKAINKIKQSYGNQLGYK